MKTALCLGAGGFIGSHLVNRLKSDGYYVVGVDLKYPEYETTKADHFIIGDLRDYDFCTMLFLEDEYDVCFQLAADMGGSIYIFTGKHDADIMHNSAQINLNICELLKNTKTKVFYSSSACIYPAYNQVNPLNPKCSEDSVTPAEPDSAYGWEKLFSEKLYLSYAKNYGMDIRIARFHNIMGERGTYEGDRAKAPAAITKKVIVAEPNSSIEIFGDGKQTRSFLYVSEAIEGVMRLMQSDFKEPINIGSEEMISINQLAEMAISISGKNLTIKNIESNAVGVRGRNSDNKLIREKLGWEPNYPLHKAMQNLFSWMNQEIYSHGIV